MRLTSPTPAQERLWNVLDEMTAKNKQPPTIRAIMSKLGMRSTSLVQYRLIRGIAAGRVARFGNQYVPHWWGKMIEENMEKYYGNKHSN